MTDIEIVEVDDDSVPLRLFIRQELDRVHQSFTAHLREIKEILMSDVSATNDLAAEQANEDRAIDTLVAYAQALNAKLTTLEQQIAAGAGPADVSATVADMRAEEAKIQGVLPTQGTPAVAPAGEPGSPAPDGGGDTNTGAVLPSPTGPPAGEVPAVPGPGAGNPAPSQIDPTMNPTTATQAEPQTTPEPGTSAAGQNPPAATEVQPNAEPPAEAAPAPDAGTPTV